MDPPARTDKARTGLAQDRTAAERGVGSPQGGSKLFSMPHHKFSVVLGFSGLVLVVGAFSVLVAFLALAGQAWALRNLTRIDERVLGGI